jgi:hypothetical protein
MNAIGVDNIIGYLLKSFPTIDRDLPRTQPIITHPIIRNHSKIVWAEINRGFFLTLGSKAIPATSTPSFVPLLSHVPAVILAETMSGKEEKSLHFTLGGI